MPPRGKSRSTQWEISRDRNERKYVDPGPLELPSATEARGLAPALSFSLSSLLSNHLFTVITHPLNQNASKWLRFHVG